MSERTGNGRRILIADDGVITRKLLERKLIALGFEVICAADGVEALQCMSNELPTAVITDLNMPNLDGLELCRSMSLDSRLAAIPTILTGANEVTESDRQRALAAGASSCVHRTPGLSEVVSALFNEIDGSREGQ